jgi:hypothetical protein
MKEPTMRTTLVLVLASLAACDREPIVLEGARVELALNPPALDFGRVAAGSPVTLSSELENRGEVALRLSGPPRLASGASGFSVSTALPETLAPGSRYRIDVTFVPAGPAGPRSTTLQVALVGVDAARAPTLRLDGEVAATIAEPTDAGTPADAPAPDGSTAASDATVDAGPSPPSACEGLVGLVESFPDVHVPSLFYRAPSMSVFALPDGQAWLTYDGTAVLHYDGAHVRVSGGLDDNTNYYSPPGPHVWGTGPDNLWMGDRDGRLRLWNGVAFREQATVGDMVVGIAADPAARATYALTKSFTGWALHRLTGDAWRREASEVTNDNFLTDVVVRGPGDVWMVASTRLLRWSGGAARRVTLPREPRAQEALRLATDGARVWLLYGTSSPYGIHEPSPGPRLYSTEDGSAWADHALPVSGDEKVFSLSMTAADDVWVGGDRRILHWDGRAWTAPAGTCTGTPQVAAMAIHAYARGRVLVAGTRTFDPGYTALVMARWEGDEWRELVRPTAVELGAIAMADATYGWAAGTRGMIYRWDGRGWLASVRLAPSVDTLDIYAEGPQLAWLATSQGLIRLESERPVFVEGVPRVAYRAVLADGAGVVWAAGEDGTLVRCAAGRCAPVVTPTRATLAALAVGTGDVLWVAGEQFVGLYSQGTWTPLPAPGGADVTALAFTHQGYATTATQAYRWSSGRWDVLDPVVVPPSGNALIPYGVRALGDTLYLLGQGGMARVHAGGRIEATEQQGVDVAPDPRDGARAMVVDGRSIRTF